MVNLFRFLTCWALFHDAVSENHLREKITHPQQQQLAVVHHRNTPSHPTHNDQQPNPPPPPPPPEYAPVKAITIEDVTSELGQAFIEGRHSPSFETFYHLFSTSFDQKYPSSAELIKQHPKPDHTFYSPTELGPIFSRRCFSLVAPQIRENYLSDRFLPHLQQILHSMNQTTLLPSSNLFYVTTSCLGVDSLGNFLGDYFESLLCAYYNGLHMISVARVWEPEEDLLVPFISKLPYVIEHPHPNSEKNPEHIKKMVKETCFCSGVCHEQTNALWTKGTKLIGPILRNAVNYHFEQLLLKINNYTTIQSSDLSNVQDAKEQLPLIPDVSVHYRCGDNFVGHYGFLPFRAYGRILKESYEKGEIQTIYILAEKKDRKVNGRNYLIETCDQIFNGLFQYFIGTFPNAKIVIRRGDDIYLDLIRLTKSKITICSVSTFCLWPAVVQQKRAYFPQTKLVVRANIAIDLGFHWITEPQVILGQHHRGSATHLLKSLKEGINLNITAI